MTTRIKLRRDTAANWAANNPILALGEPGLDTDANQVKYGDGVTAWNDLVYALGGSGGGRSARWLGIINTCGSGQYTTQSIDGSSWTAPVGVQPEWWSYYSWMALGANKIVYYQNTPGQPTLAYANDPASEPTPCSPQSVLHDVNGNHSPINWNDMKYLGGYFILVGSYLETNVSPNLWLPQWRYSSDGVNWHVGAVNITELAALVAAEVANGNTYVDGIYLNSLEYNGTGWFLTGGWDYDGPSNNPTQMGGFYITSVTDTLNSATHATGVPDSDNAHWDGSRWYTWYQDNEDNIFHTNTSVNPTTGTWTSHLISDIVAPLFGTRSGYNYSVEGITSGVVNNTHYTLITIDDGRSLVTSDGGTTWTGVVPNVTETRIQDFDGAIELYNTGDAGLTTGDKITITGSSVPAMNGVFYVNHNNNRWYDLYSDQALTQSVDTSGWTNDSVFVTGCEFVYGTNKMRVSSTDGLRVGMIAPWNFGGYWGGVITAINGLELTFDVPAYSSETNASLYFYNTVTLSTGSYNYRPKFGGGRFIAQLQNYGGAQYIAYSKGNPAQQSSWQVVFPTDNQNLTNSWVTDFQYGFVNNPVSSWVYQDPNLLEVTNEAILTDKFTVSTTGSGQYDPPLSVSMVLDPNQAGWYITSQCQWGDGDLGSISSFWENDVRMSINSNAFGIRQDGTLFVSHNSTDRGYIQFGPDEQLAIGLDTGDTQAPDSVAIGKSAGRYNQGVGTGFSVAIGCRAGDSDQGHHAIAIGRFAGYHQQGNESIAIGHGAGKTSQHANSIVLNASGGIVNSPDANTFVVKPIRNNVSSQSLYYDADTGEITYGNAPGGLPNTNTAGLLHNDGSGNLSWQKTVNFTVNSALDFDNLEFGVAVDGSFNISNISGTPRDITYAGTCTIDTTGVLPVYGAVTVAGPGTTYPTNNNINVAGGTAILIVNDLMASTTYRVTFTVTAPTPSLGYTIFVEKLR